MCAMAERLSTIGTGLRIDGHLVGDGSIEIQGHFEGSIHIGGELLIARGAVVRADVLASRVVVFGLLAGSVRATREIHVGSTGDLQGTVQGQLLVDDGGVYRGHMTPGRARPQKTVNTRRRPPALPHRSVEEADRLTEDGLPSISSGAAGPAGRLLRDTAERDPPSDPDEAWFGGHIARRAPTPVLEITEGEPPPRSVSGIPALTADQVALRLGAVERSGPLTGDIPPLQEEPQGPLSGGADPTGLPTGPTRLAIANPPQRRTTAPGVAPFRHAFGGPLPAQASAPRPAPPGPRPASVSGRAVPVVGPTVPVPGAGRAALPEPDADLSDSWFLPDDEDL